MARIEHLLLVPSHGLAARALDLALRLRHTVYDGMYLALALVRQVPLVTADLRLLRVIREGLDDESVAVELEDV